MKARTLAAVAVALSPVGFAGTAHLSPASDSARAVAAADLLVASTDGLSCFGCYQGPYGNPPICTGEDEHFDLASSPSPHYKTDPHEDYSCEQSDCDVHDFCNQQPGGEFLADLAVVVAEGDDEALGRLYRENVSMRVDARTGELTVVDCQDHVVAEFALDSRTASRLLRH